jgi:hypothetical protein
MQISELVPPVNGRVRLQQVLVDSSGKPLLSWREGKLLKNQICYNWGVVASALFRRLQDGNNYYVGGMYLEFDNSGSAVDPVPSPARNTTVNYYRDLSGTADYLRVPLLASAGSCSDSDLFGGDNVATFISQSSSTTGNRVTSPLTFSDANNSRIYGAALVAFCDDGDTTKDLIISRIYLQPEDQVEKVAGSQIYTSWSLTFA